MAAIFGRRHRRERKWIRYRCPRRIFWPELKHLLWKIHPALLMLMIGFVFFFGVVQTTERQIRPMLMTVAETQIHNRVTELLEETVAQDLKQREFSYDDLMYIQRDNEGKITALTTDMARMNLFRNDLVGQILKELEFMEFGEIHVPIGSLTQSELFWGKGPGIKIQTFTVGTVTAEFESEFSDAGVNQTLHKIWLNLSVPMKILLPGGNLEREVDTRICIAETVIVGQVPSLLQKANP